MLNEFGLKRKFKFKRRLWIKGGNSIELNCDFCAEAIFFLSGAIMAGIEWKTSAAACFMTRAPLRSSPLFVAYLFRWRLTIKSSDVPSSGRDV
jgi:hypothetical protein